MRLVMVPAPSLALTRAVDGHNRQVLGREVRVARVCIACLLSAGVAAACMPAPHCSI